MSELKTYGMNDPEVGDEYEMYKVSDVDDVIANHKYKRCLTMAMWCESKSKIYNEFVADANEYMPSYATRFRKKAELYQKWHKRWMELAEKFKEAK